MGDMMNGCNCDPLAFTTAVNTLTAALAQNLTDSELTLLSAVLTQMGDTLATIAVQRSLCKSNTEQENG